MSNERPLNLLTIKVYNGTDELYAVEASLRYIVNLKMETFYPGGLYGACSFDIPQSLKVAHLFRLHLRVVIYNGLTTVYEGYITSIAPSLKGGLETLKITAVGAWGKILARQTLNKRWLDTGTSNRRWLYLRENSGQSNNQQMVTVTRGETGIRMVPKRVEASNEDFTRVRYTMPTGQTAKRIKCSMTLAEEAIRRPEFVKFYDNSGGTYTDLSNTIDDDGTTFETVTIDNNDSIYIGFRDEIATKGGIRVTLGTQKNTNNNVTLRQVEFSDTVPIMQTMPVGVVDGTFDGSRTLGQSGDITLPLFPADETTAPHARMTRDDANAFWYELEYNSTSGTATVDIVRIDVFEEQPTAVRIRNVGTGANVVSRTTDGTTSVDHTFTTPPSQIDFVFESVRDQLYLNNGSVYAEWSSVEVYSETGNINPTEIVTDVLGVATDISSKDTKIGSNTTALGHFTTDGSETLASILTRVAQSVADWAVRLLPSTRFADTSGEPVLEFAAVPALSGDHDYEIDIDTLTGFEMATTTDDVFNYIIVKYTDENGIPTEVTPDDNSSLKDDDSISTYGQLDRVLSVGRSTSGAAAAEGIVFLGNHKLPRLEISKTITINGFVKGQGGVIVPASEIEAGKIIKFTNFLNDISDQNEAGTFALISRTRYTHDNQQCRLHLTRQNDFNALVSRSAFAF